MALTVGDIITGLVRPLLVDVSTTNRWGDPELILYFNDGCREIARLRPEVTATLVDIPLVAGAVQSLPAGYLMMLEGICNQDPSTGNAVGRVIRRVKRSTLDTESPDWMSAAPAAVVRRYVVSLTTPRTFYVHPPSDGGVTAGIKAALSGPPAKVTALIDVVPIPDTYGAALTNYVVFRAFKSLIESPEAQNRAESYASIFYTQLTSSDAVMEGRNAKVREPTLPEDD